MPGGAEATAQGKQVWFAMDEASTAPPPAGSGGVEFSLDDWDDELMDLPPVAPRHRAGPDGRSDGGARASSRPRLAGRR